MIVVEEIPVSAAQDITLDHYDCHINEWQQTIKVLSLVGTFHGGVEEYAAMLTMLNERTNIELFVVGSNFQQNKQLKRKYYSCRLAIDWLNCSESVNGCLLK